MPIIPATDLQYKLLNLINEITGRKCRVLPNGTIRLLKTFTLNEVEDALKVLTQDPWHKSRIRNLRYEYLLRATTIDHWLQQVKPTIKTNILNTEPLVEI